MIRLTVFTPTFNRANTLSRTYESLCNQTCKDFEWLIIDDGSTDNTREIVEGWMDKDKIKIRYILKDNGGLHTGYNTAFANIDAELNVCIDSDDYMPEDAVENILNVWDNTKDKSEIVGIIGLDFIHGTNQPIGGFFKDVDTHLLHFYQMQQIHHGDTKNVLRTDIAKKIEPMPSFKNEKNFNPVYYFWYSDFYGKYIISNHNFCTVDYQPDGMSANILRQYRNSPNSFAQLRRYSMRLPWLPVTKHFKNAIHYVSACMFSKQWNFIKTSPKKTLTILAIPMGIALNIYIRIKTRK